ncbi:EexN family lipoprotein [Acidithiobacillus ferridurans]|uniref:EexN family lipoprotein n=1 Tax=Acidithiobacillus ferridurans TaxID=1232575 RepID=UPI001C0688A7|nr:EexN family lipoprotein [Acidithiobacillus ferridurans]MBU2721070.1 EexN family lipoprotein [Acidithiobacillus ferridurans]MBU2733475.1 EexN family lipoprotein [Acidithiobacillus ferridurans]
MQKTKGIIAMICIVGLAGCSSSHSGPGGMHKVDWYTAHPKVAAQEVKWCNNNAPRKVLAACQNAYQAQSDIATKQFFGVPKGGIQVTGSPAAPMP